jgi:hypothetical protein
MDRHPASPLGNVSATNVAKRLPEPGEGRLLFLAKKLLFDANNFRRAKAAFSGRWNAVSAAEAANTL